jgi:general L-amino acid transport system permease protein
MTPNVQRGPVPFWRDTRVLQWVAQIVSAILVLGFLAFFISNVVSAARLRGLDLGFGFLQDSAGFALGESPVAFDPSMSFGRAFLVGLLNTLQVALVGVVLATLLGLVAALARLSTNWLVSKIASFYIETIRNVPLLVQLFFWYFAVFQQLPPVRRAVQLPGPTFLSQRGLYLPWPRPAEGAGLWLLILLGGVVLAVIAYVVLFRRRINTGRQTYAVPISLAILVLIPLAGWFLVGGRPFDVSLPELQRFNFEGGLRITTEFAALLAGLVIYTGAFIAEVVRAGILAVPRGQVEAARAVGLTQGKILRLVVLPQALRVIIPPLISQYLNLTKNSSLAIAIGYPDLFFVGRTIINQAGRAIPVFALVMGTYLVLSLITSAVMNVYNRRVRLVER